MWGVWSVNCIKCGKKCKSKHIFCDECCEGMKDYPVKPGTPIYLPSRPLVPQEKRKPAKKKRPSRPEDLISRLRSANRWLVAALVVCLIAFLLACGALVLLLEDAGTPLF